MFTHMNVHRIQDIVRQQNDNKFNENEFYKDINKRYLESIKDFLENPKFSMKSFMVMANIRNNIFEKCKKEYTDKYELSSDFFTRKNIGLFPTNTNISS